MTTNGTSSLSGKRVVFVGAGNSGFSEISETTDEISPYSATGSSPALVSNRLSYVLGLEGPSMTIDTACSSGLVAVHAAVQSLRSGECDTALAAAVNVLLNPAGYIGYCRARMLSADGRCRTFDASASGYVRSEGCGAVVLRRVDASELHSQGRCLGIVRAAVMNQDGRSASFTAPNGPSQEAVISTALHEGGVPAEAVSFFETHGTGTALGDPIEVGALRHVFGLQHEGAPAPPLVLGALKSTPTSLKVLP